jgi:hypothetical protein
MLNKNSTKNLGKRNWCRLRKNLNLKNIFIELQAIFIGGLDFGPGTDPWGKRPDGGKYHPRKQKKGQQLYIF